jgi:hypothetical protein
MQHPQTKKHPAGAQFQIFGFFKTFQLLPQTLHSKEQHLEEELNNTSDL